MGQVRTRVSFFAILACEVGRREQEIDLPRELPLALEELERRIGYPLVQKLKEGRVNLLINGRAAKIAQGPITLAEGDTLAFIPSLGGG